MEESFIVFKEALPIYLIVILGAILRRTSVLTTEMDKGVMTMAVNLFFPCLILDKILGAQVLQSIEVVIVAMGLGFGLILLGTAIAWLLGPMMGLRKGSGRRTFAVAGGLQNYGYLAIPLVAYLFPGDNVMAVLFIHNLGVELAMWTIGLMLISGSFPSSPKIFLKGPIIAVIVGLLLIQFGWNDDVPIVLRRSFSMLGYCAVPLSLLLVGTVMYDLIGKVKFDWKIGVGGVLVRLVIVSALFLLVAKYLPLPIELKQVLVVQAALPSAMFPIVLSRYYGGRSDVAVIVVIATTITSLVTMPLVISYGADWVGV